MTRAEQMDHAYRVSLDAFRDTLKAGVVESDALQDVQAAMRRLAPHAAAFGAAHYDELKTLLQAVEKLPVRVVQPPERTTLKQFLMIIGAAVVVFCIVAISLRSF